MKPSKLLISQALSVCLLVLCSSCSSWTGEVLESQYQFPIVPDPVYSFKRQGQSSVNILDPQRAKSATDVLYARFLRTAYIRNDKAWTELNTLFRNGGNNEIALEPLIASSPRSLDHQTEVKADFESILRDVRSAGGYTDGLYPIEAYNRVAQVLMTGFVGYGIGDEDRVYALENGLIPSEQYRGMIAGAIFLDKILNEYLSIEELEDQTLIRQHEDQKLIPGRNYTLLEHHWDLAYGYYKQIQSLILSNSLPSFRGSETKLENAFALGRLAISEYRYQEAINHVRTIRDLLSLIFAARAIQELQGVNTLANLREQRQSAFRFISRGLGYVYALQFTRSADGKGYLTRQETLSLLDTILQDPQGLWSEHLEDRLLQLSKQIELKYQHKN